jgi:phage shock protein A
VELQAKARRAVADVVTARKRLEMQARQLTPTVARLEEQARTALQQGSQDAAREALTWRAALQGELTELERHAAPLVADEARLRQTVSRIDLQMQQLRVRRDALRASYAAARARTEIGRALAAARLDDSDTLLALREADERVARTRTMADALEGIAAHGVQRAALPGAGEVLYSEADVANELSRMEEELLWGQKRPDEPGGPDRPIAPPPPPGSPGQSLDD